VDAFELPCISRNALAQKPDNPGVFVGPSSIGEQVTYDTDYVTLDVSLMRVTSHGPSSAALDVEWVFDFKIAGEYVEVINIVYRDEPVPAQAADLSQSPQQVTIETGLFQVGSFKANDRVFLPRVNHQSIVQN
jgi:hypothetical protein